MHAHSSGQYVDGLRAPFVIHATKEPHVYDEEFTVILGDWYHDEHDVLIKQFVNIANPGGAEPVPGQLLLSFSFYLFHLPANQMPASYTLPKTAPTSDQYRDRRPRRERPSASMRTPPYLSSQARPTVCAS